MLPDYLLVLWRKRSDPVFGENLVRQVAELEMGVVLEGGLRRFTRETKRQIVTVSRERIFQPVLA